MKYFNWFKGFVFLALACSVTAQGSTFNYTESESNPQTTDPSSAGYSITVSTGKVVNTNASANLTISGENSKVSVEKEGTVTLVAGKSIVLHPGTKIKSGSFLYASIGTASKSGKQKKMARLVTVEENRKIEEQASLSYAAMLFSPFPSLRKGVLHAGDTDNGSFTTSNHELSAVSPEQQRKEAVDSYTLHLVNRKQVLTSYRLAPETYAYRPQVMMVLRL